MTVVETKFSVTVGIKRASKSLRFIYKIRRKSIQSGVESLHKVLNINMTRLIWLKVEHRDYYYYYSIELICDPRNLCGNNNPTNIKNYNNNQLWCRRFVPLWYLSVYSTDTSNVFFYCSNQKQLRWGETEISREGGNEWFPNVRIFYLNSSIGLERSEKSWLTNNPLRN